MMKKEDIKIMVQKHPAIFSGMSNWKTPGPDGVQGFWFIRMTNLHDQLAKYLQVCLSTAIVLLWMKKGITVLIMKDSKKGGVASNYRSIACLHIMWKTLTGITEDEIYGHLTRISLLQNE